MTAAQRQRFLRQRAEDFNTDHLNDEQKKIANALIAMLDDPTASGGGCTAFYTPEQWEERGEKYGKGSVLIVCHDGGAFAPYLNWDYCQYPKIDQCIEVLEAIGYYAEGMYNWCSAIYKK